MGNSFSELRIIYPQDDMGIYYALCNRTAVVQNIFDKLVYKQIYLFEINYKHNSYGII